MRANIITSQSLSAPNVFENAAALARGLAGNGWDVKMLLQDLGRSGAAKIATRKDKATRSPNADISARRFPKKNPPTLLTSPAGLTRAVLKHHAELNILYNIHPSSLTAALVGKTARRTPFVVVADNLESESARPQSQQKRKVFRLFERLAVRAGSGVIAQTSCLAEALARFSRDNARTAYIPPGIDPSQFPADPDRCDELRERLDIEGRPVALYFSGMDSGGRIAALIDSFAVVARRVPAAVLLLIGEGELAAVREYARRVGVGRGVFAVGRVERSDLPSYLSLADVVVDPVAACFSAAAVPPRQLLLAMLLGRPVLTNNVGDRASLLGGGGIAVRAGSARAFEQALYLLLVDRVMRGKMGEKGKRRIMEKFLWANLVGRYIDFFFRFLGEDSERRSSGQSAVFHGNLQNDPIFKKAGISASDGRDVMISL